MDPTHCPRGHPYDNDYARPAWGNGKGRNRRCRECNRIKSLWHKRWQQLEAEFNRPASDMERCVELLDQALALEVARHTGRIE